MVERCEAWAQRAEPCRCGVSAYVQSKKTIHRRIWGVHKTKPKWCWIMTALELAGVIDDSGSNKPEPYFALAGFISDTDNWEADGKFVDRWKAVLDGPPTL